MGRRIVVDMSIAAISIVISLLAIAITIVNVLLMRATERRIEQLRQQPGSAYYVGEPDDELDDWMLFVADDNRAVRKFNVV